jgi:hypothetical protein
MDFEEKVKSMKFSEIMQAMITGLNKPNVTVNMDTFGWAKGFWIFKKCFGCAATNAVCEISGVKFNRHNIDDNVARAEAVKTSYLFLDRFEGAINQLRLGNEFWYNHYAQMGGFAKIPAKFLKTIDALPELSTENYKALLSVYQEVCDKIKKAGF